MKSKGKLHLAWRFALPGGAALLLWVASLILPFATRSERFHFVVPLVWLVDFAVYGHKERRAPTINLAAGALAFLLVVWSVTDTLALQIHGRITAAEYVWQVTLWSSVVILWAALDRGLRVVGNRVSRFRPAKWRSVGSTLLRVLLELVVMLPYAYVVGATHRVKIADTLTPRSFHMAYENARFTSRGDHIALAGWFIPCRNSPGAVLICHGVGANRACFLRFARLVHDDGYSVFLFDFRDHGTSAGHTTSFGYDEKRDVAGAVSYLKSRPGRNGIVGYGFSMGGSALLQDVPADPFCGVIVDSTFADLDSVAVCRIAFLPSWIKRALLAEIDLYGRAELGVSVSQIAPVERVSSISPYPLLIIHGTSDRTIPYTDAIANYDAAREPKMLWLVPGAGHLGSEAVQPREYEERLDAFLRRCYGEHK